MVTISEATIPQATIPQVTIPPAALLQAGAWLRCVARGPWPDPARHRPARCRAVRTRGLAGRATRRGVARPVRTVVRRRARGAGRMSALRRRARNERPGFDHPRRSTLCLPRTRSCSITQDIASLSAADGRRSCRARRCGARRCGHQYAQRLAGASMPGRDR